MFDWRGWAAMGVALAALGLVTAGEARAELFRCTGPDGGTVYTDDKSTCPGVEEHEPKGRVLTVPTSPESRPPAARARLRRQHDARLRDQAEEAEAARWRRKKEAKEAELQDLLTRRDSLREFLTWCNRGGYVMRRDEAGIKRRVSCTTIRSQYASFEERAETVRTYLDTGLAEECRRAGCLPGWIR